jgi:hypothetical protein
MGGSRFYSLELDEGGHRTRRPWRTGGYFVIVLALLFTLVDFELPKSHWFLTETTQYPNGAVNFQILGRFDTYGECMTQRGNNDDRECVDESGHRGIEA